MIPRAQFHPDSYIGLDLNSTGIAFYPKRDNLTGLEFVQGDAVNVLSRPIFRRCDQYRIFAPLPSISTFSR